MPVHWTLQHGFKTNYHAFVCCYFPPPLSLEWLITTKLKWFLNVLLLLDFHNVVFSLRMRTVDNWEYKNEKPTFSLICLALLGLTNPVLFHLSWSYPGNLERIPFYFHGFVKTSALKFFWASSWAFFWAFSLGVLLGSLWAFFWDPFGRSSGLFWASFWALFGRPSGLVLGVLLGVQSASSTLP